MEQQRELAMLSEIDKDQQVTQRSLSRTLGMSLGLANVYLKRLAKKGYIKITTVPGSRLLRYMLTPQGLAEKTRLTYEFARYSYQYIRDVRRDMWRQFQRLPAEGLRRVAVYGTDELAELAYLAVQEAGLEFVGFVTPGGGRTEFLGRSVVQPTALAMAADAVIVFSERQQHAVGRLVPPAVKVVLCSAGR